MDNVVAGIRPHCPPDSDEWLSGDVWDLLSGCWSPFWDKRPDLTTVINTLHDAGDVIELESRGFREADLISFLNNCRGGSRSDPDAKKAQGIVDILDLVGWFGNHISLVSLRYAQALDDGGLHKRRRKKCLKYLRKLCGTFGILPSSFILEPTFNERGVEPFATGGFSHVYKATYNGRTVAIKTLRIATTVDPEKAHRVSSTSPQTSIDRSYWALSFW